MKMFYFYTDAGHGWLAVKREFLDSLGILDKISSYSYQKGQTVYLEEDCDASLFINVMKEKGWQRGIDFDWDHYYTDDYSPIRKYNRFKV